MRIRRNALVVAVAAASLVVTVGCGSDEPAATQSSSTTSSGSGSTAGGSGAGIDEACARIGEIDETNFDDDAALAIEKATEARAASPESLRPHWDQVIEMMQTIEAMDPEDPDFVEDLAALNARSESPELNEAFDEIQAFATDECGLDIQIAPGSGSASPGASGSRSPTFDTTGEGEAPPTVAGVSALVDERFGSEPWFDGLFGADASWSFRYVDDVAVWTVMVGDPADAGATEADVLAVCDEIAAYLDGAEVLDDVEITVEGPGKVVVATREPGEACEAA